MSGDLHLEMGIANPDPVVLSEAVGTVTHQRMGMWAPDPDLRAAVPPTGFLQPRPSSRKIAHFFVVLLFWCSICIFLVYLEAINSLKLVLGVQFGRGKQILQKKKVVNRSIYIAGERDVLILSLLNDAILF